MDINFTTLALNVVMTTPKEGIEMVECPVCGAKLELNQNTVKGELVECPECVSLLEVTGVEPFTVAPAPAEEEDWGE